MANDAEEKPPCGICLDEEKDDTGQPPMRDCACRGSTGLGYVHVSCLIQYATKKSQAIRESRVKDDDDGNDPFVHCPTCKQDYNGELRLELSRAHVKMFEIFPDDDFDKIFAHSSLAQALEGVKKYDEADKEYVCNIQRLRHENLKHIDLFKDVELDALVFLSKCRIKNGEISKAYQTLEEARGIAMERKDEKNMMSISREMREVKTKFGMDTSDYDTEYAVEAAWRYMEKEIEEHGKDSAEVIAASKRLIYAYAENGNFLEALKLAKVSIGQSSRIFGSEHEETKWFEEKYDFIREKYASALNMCKKQLK